MDGKLEYLVNELWVLAWNASVQRADLYGSKKSTDQAFREKVIYHLSSHLIPQYANSRVTEEQHYTNIEHLILYANSVGRDVLGQPGYKYGVAQKLLNLALKYHWCLGLISEPPHCPVDRIVIGETRFRNKINWTRIVQRSEYQNVIEDIKRLAANKGLSISMWELSIYSRR